MTAPKVALIVPSTVEPADSEAIRAANPGVFLILAQTEVPAAEPTANRNTWLTIINVVKTLWSVGKTAAIFSGPLGILAAGAVNIGLDQAEQAITGSPEIEDWPLSRIAAARAAVAVPLT